MVAECAWNNKLFQSLEKWLFFKRVDGSFETKHWIISRTAQI